MEGAATAKLFQPNSVSKPFFSLLPLLLLASPLLRCLFSLFLSCSSFLLLFFYITKICCGATTCSMLSFFQKANALSSFHGTLSLSLSLYPSSFLLSSSFLFFFFSSLFFYILLLFLFDFVVSEELAIIDTPLASPEIRIR